MGIFVTILSKCMYIIDLTIINHNSIVRSMVCVNGRSLVCYVYGLTVVCFKMDGGILIFLCCHSFFVCQGLLFYICALTKTKPKTKF